MPRSSYIRVLKQPLGQEFLGDMAWEKRQEREVLTQVNLVKG